MNKDILDKSTKLYIKNMVCRRCIMVIKDQLNTLGLHPDSVELGEVIFSKDDQKILDQKMRDQVSQKLLPLGFEIIDNRRARIIEKIKNNIITLVHHSDHGSENVNLSTLLSEKLHLEYPYLSSLFSAVEGTTIEKYYIAQRIEKAKELLIYDELTLTQIADQLGYSSVAYLSSQFKKITGLSPSYFKNLKQNRRIKIEDL